MLSGVRRKSFVLIITLLLGGVLVGCGSTDEQEDPGSSESPQQQLPQQEKSEAPDGDPEGTVIAIMVEGGEVKTSGDVVELSVGDPVRIEVTSDVADEIHVHGYERKLEIDAGATAIIRFIADIPGVFEVELEDAGLELVQLRVR